MPPQLNRLVPHFILEQYAAGEDHGRFPGAALFVDIGGFSTITDRLMQHGQHGAEVLAGVMKAVFDPLTQAVYSQGGFITGFAGDAFTAVFPQDAQPATLPALAAAMRIQQQMQTRPDFDTAYGRFTLSAKVGVALGEVIWGIVTAADGRRSTYYFQGSAIDGSAAAEKVAQAGDVMVDAAFYGHLAPQVAAEPVGEFYRVTAVDTPLPAPQPVKLPPLNPDHLAQFFPPAVTRPQQSGEFRQVVHLFISLPTIRSDAQLRIFMQTVFRLQAQYGGLLNRLDFGDKGAHLLLFWGVPVAYENDIQRALHFILDLQTQTAIPINGGITYQIAHAGFIGSSLRGEYTCHGRGVNLAARFMTAAPRGEIWVDGAVARRAGAQFDLEFEAEKSFKGFAEPQKVYILYERKDSEEPLFRGRLVGREAELRRLRDYMQPLVDGRSPGTLVIWGEPGAGKSRLAHEFLSNHLDQEWLIFLAQTDEILRQPFNPFRYWLKNYFGLASGLAEARHKRSFNRRLDGLIASSDDERLADELDRTRSFLGALVGLRWPDSLYEQLDAEGRYANTLTALITLLQAESRQQPVILFLEDAHWLDEDSAAFLSRLLASLAAPEAGPYPIAVLATARLEGAGLPLDDFEYEEIHLGGLSRTDLAGLAEAQLRAPAAGNLLDLLVAQAEGNPFFAEQILRYLQDAGQLTLQDSRYQVTDLAQSPLPDDVSALLVARLDRLSQEVRDVVQTAAVLGREFEASLLSRMLTGDAALPQKMMQAEQEAIWSALNEIRYIFRHALLRDAAYRMQLRARRQALHRLAMGAIESVYADNLAGRYGELAYHASLADLVEPAFRYHLAAGDEAMELNTAQTAVTHFGQALDLFNQVDSTPAQRQTLCTAYGRALELTSDFAAAIDHYQAMQRLAQQSNDPPLELAALIAEAIVYSMPHDFNDLALAESLSKTALEMAQREGNVVSEAKTLWTLMRVYTWSNRLELAFATGERALAFAKKHALNEQLAYISLDMVETYARGSEMQPLMNAAKQAVSLWRELNNPPMLANSLAIDATMEAILGNYDEALALGDEGLAINRLINNRFGQVILFLPQAHVCLQKMAIGKALAVTEEAINLAGEVNFVGGQNMMSPIRSQLFLAVGAIEQAERSSERLLPHLSEPFLAGMVPGAVALVKLAAGDVTKADDILKDISFDPEKLPLHMPMLREKALITQAIIHKDFAGALTMGQTVLAFAQKQGILFFIPDFHFLHGQALIGLGRSDEARAALHEAIVKMRPTEHRWGFLQLLTLLADLEAAAEHDEMARNLRQEGRAFVDEIIEQIPEALQPSFLAMPEVDSLLT